MKYDIDPDDFQTLKDYLDNNCYFDHHGYCQAHAVTEGSNSGLCAIGRIIDTKPDLPATMLDVSGVTWDDDWRCTVPEDCPDLSGVTCPDHSGADNSGEWAQQPTQTFNLKQRGDDCICSHTYQQHANNLRCNMTGCPCRKHIIKNGQPTLEELTYLVYEYMIATRNNQTTRQISLLNDFAVKYT